jgi:hypothetical protein
MLRPRSFAQDSRWAELVPRLPAAGLLEDAQTAETLVAGMRGQTP